MSTQISRWRDETRVKQALGEVKANRRNSERYGELDRAIVEAAYSGAQFREIAVAAGLSLGVVHKRAIRYRERFPV